MRPASPRLRAARLLASSAALALLGVLAPRLAWADEGDAPCATSTCSWARTCAEEAAGLATLAAAAAAGKVEVKDALDRLQAARVRLSTAPGMPPGGELPGLDAAATTLGPLAARGEEANPEEALSSAALRLGAACEAALGGALAVPHERARLESILRRPEFEQAGLDEAAGKRLLATLLDAIGELLGGQAAYTAASSGRAIFLGALAALLVGWLFVLVRRRVAARRQAEASLHDDAVPLEAPDLYRSRAAEALAAGRPREAIRAALLASLAALERAHLLRPGRARTNRECIADLARRGAPRELEERFAELAVRYDRVFYGLAEVPASDAAALAAMSDEIVRLSAQARAGDVAARPSGGRRP